MEACQKWGAKQPQTRWVPLLKEGEVVLKVIGVDLAKPTKPKN